MTYHDFVRRFCVVDQGPFGERIVGSRNAEQLAAMLRPFTLRRSMDVVPVPLLWGHVVLAPERLPAMPPDVAELDAVVQAALAEATGGEAARAAFDMVDQMHTATLRRWTGMAKAAAVGEQIRVDLEGGMDRVVVFGVHTDVLRTVASTIGADRTAVIHGAVSAAERQSAIDAFQGGELTALVCQLTIASTALTLTAACHVDFAETGWTPGDVDQAAKRLHRIGQRRPVIARLFSLKGSADEAVNRTLVQKARDIARFAVAIGT